MKKVNKNLLKLFNLPLKYKEQLELALHKAVLEQENKKFDFRSRLYTNITDEYNNSDIIPIVLYIDDNQSLILGYKSKEDIENFGAVESSVYFDDITFFSTSELEYIIKCISLLEDV